MGLFFWDPGFSKFKNLVNLRASGKPIAYLIGTKAFWKYDFFVTEEVLIPRPDSELIIEKVLDDISFNATDRTGETITVDQKYVQDNLGNLVKDTDLSKFIL